MQLTQYTATPDNNMILKFPRNMKRYVIHKLMVRFQDAVREGINVKVTLYLSNTKILLY